ncbi:HutD/Ves family protein [Eoetvoesiella caeni]
MQTAPTATSPETHFHLIRAADLAPVPWKNGGGITRQIAICPEGATLDTFSWRISAAVVEQAGPFSIFNGIDRFIVVTHGASMTLVDAVDQSRRSLQQGQTFAFAGEAALAAELPDGPIQDFNLMVRRGQGLGELTVRQSAQRLVLYEGSTVLHCVSGVFTISQASINGREYQLAAGDSLQATLPAGCQTLVEIVPEQAGSSLIDARIRHTAVVIDGD